MAPKKNQQKCPQCGSVTLMRDISSPSNTLTCVVCSTVVEESPIVSEVQFSESASGAATVQGSFVGNDQSRATTGMPGKNALNSREQTMARAKRNIRDIARSLKIPEYVSDSAAHWFTLALANNFVQGRKSLVVHALCLYIGCRRAKTHHMLIDFSSRIQVSVFAVGATFLRLVRTLHLTNIPLADPSLYIEHFADKLSLGQLKNKVIRDALKLCKRMADDWIHEGRRPAGIAGACLLLAARMNNVRRTHTELVAVSHVAEVTLQKRLNEFKQTKGADLSVKKFRETENYEETLPPSFLKNQEKELKKSRRNETKEPQETYSKDIRSVVEDGWLTDLELHHEMKRIAEKQRAMADQGPLKTQEYVHTDKSSTVRKLYRFEFPQVTTGELLAKIPSDPENLEDVDDEEVEGFLLSEQESQLKTRVWHGLNRDFLLEQEQKRLKEEADEVAGHGKPKKRRIKKQDDDEMVKAAIGESVSGSLGAASGGTLNVQQLMKKKSSKINYSMVGQLIDL